MKIIIVGAGKVGRALLETLVEENHDVVIVDSNPDVVEQVVNQFDVMGYVGSGCERGVLTQSEVEHADFFIACTSRDEMNILCCVLAKQLGAKHTVARVRDPEYSKEVDGLSEFLSLDYAINPEYRTAVVISKILKYPSAINVESFVNGKVNMVEFHVETGNAIIGKSLMDVAKDFRSKVLVAMVKRGEDVIIPRGDFVIQENDDIHIIGEATEIVLFCKKLQIFKPSAKSVFLIGGSKIAYYLADRLSKNGVKVKILEQDAEKCAMLSEALPKVTVICGDGTDHELLKEEGALDADACVTLTGIDEQNVIVSLYAFQNGVSKVVTKVDRESVMTMVGKLGIGTVVAPKNIIANHIIRFVRSHQAESGSGINTLYKLYDKAEALEFTAEEDFSGFGISLKDLHIDRDILIGGILRKNEFIIPDGSTTIEAGDKVLVLAKTRRVQALQDILG